MGESRPSFKSLLTCGRSRQTDSIRFCSHAAQAPAKANPCVATAWLQTHEWSVVRVEGLDSAHDAGRHPGPDAARLGPVSPYGACDRDLEQRLDLDVLAVA